MLQDRPLRRPDEIPTLTAQIQSAGRLRLVGELDRSTRGLVTAVLAELTSPELLVDVTRLYFADAAGLGVLAAEDARRRKIPGRLLLFGASPFLRRTLRAADLSFLLPWHTRTAADDDWRRRAACRDIPTQVFFESPADLESAAKELCFRCPVAGSCLTYALRTKQESGIWGGLTTAERQLLTAAPAISQPIISTGSEL
jgi:WhiB family transcriptional regulator, redox-sensing transcriptional regulator